MIIYFSGTGNSKYVADMLGKKLDDQVVDATKMIKNKIKGEFESKRPFVFVSPNYTGQLPRVFKKFIKESVFKGNKSVYFMVTCGVNIGNIQNSLVSLCKYIDLEYRGVLEVVMPENYIAMYPVPNEQESKEIMKKAIPVIEKGIDVIKKGDDLDQRKISIIDNIKSNISNNLFYTFNVKTKKFRVKDTCISCGKCASVCLLNNIELVDRLPKWGNDCTHCMACISYCPTEAIEYGEISIGKPRYQCKKYDEE